jgi:hypothetical protein
MVLKVQHQRRLGLRVGIAAAALIALGMVALPLMWIGATAGDGNASPIGATVTGGPSATGRTAAPIGNHREVAADRDPEPTITATPTAPVGGQVAQPDTPQGQPAGQPSTIPGVTSQPAPAPVVTTPDPEPTTPDPGPTSPEPDPTPSPTPPLRD